MTKAPVTLVQIADIVERMDALISRARTEIPPRSVTTEILTEAAVVTEILVGAAVEIERLRAEIAALKARKG